MAKTETKLAPETDGNTPHNAEYYAGLLTELESKGSREFWFLKEGKSRFKLLDGDGSNPFYLPVQRPGWQGGKPSTKYIIKAITFPDGDQPTVKGVLLPKTVIKSIVGLLAEGYDLFGPNGNGVVIVKSGTGLDTSYSTMATPKPVPAPADVITMDLSLEDLAELLVKSDEARASNPTAGKGKPTTTALGPDDQEW